MFSLLSLLSPGKSVVGPAHLGEAAPFTKRCWLSPVAASCAVHELVSCEDTRCVFTFASFRLDLERGLRRVCDAGSQLNPFAVPSPSPPPQGRSCRGGLRPHGPGRRLPLGRSSDICSASLSETRALSCDC